MTCRSEPYLYSNAPQLVEDAGVQYRLDKKVGCGQSGSVFKAHLLTRVVALKLKPKRRECEGFGEAWVHAQLYHPNIVDLYHAFSDEHHYYLAMEYCPNGSLADVLQLHGALTLSEVPSLFIQILGAVGYMHDQAIIHRDLRAKNVLIDSQGHVKVADFSLAVSVGYPMLSSGSGYGASVTNAPEVIVGGDLDDLGRDLSWQPSSDIWSLGVLLYHILTNQYPFETPHDVVIGEYCWPIGHALDAAYKPAMAAVALMLTVQTPRCTPDHIAHHDFFSQGQYPAFGEVLPSLRSHIPAHYGQIKDRMHYQTYCREAGVGFDANGDKWPRQGRLGPRQPILHDDCGIVDPMPWGDLRCRLVDL